MTTRFLMIGGFLGAGKTTLIGRLARHYLDKGMKVGVVTNDQANDLVDTHALRAQGFHVGEVPGACFCCKFEDLVATAVALGQHAQPDIILAEPVGSCTDLAATVIEPLRHLYADRYEVGPLAVLLKPEHGRKILSGDANLGFSPKAAYIFLKQIEEADIVAVNKIDRLDPAERETLVKLVEQRFPGKHVLALSAREGEGLEALVEAMQLESPARERFMDVDYDVYAAGEAELGWLNCQVALESAAGQTFALDDIAVALVGAVRDALAKAGAEAAHVKVLVQTPDASAVANLVTTDGQAELSLESSARATTADMIVNARAAIAPEELETLVVAAVQEATARQQAAGTVHAMQRFRPGRPVPTHRHTHPH